MAATSRTASRLDIAFQPIGEFRRVLLNTAPIRPAFVFIRSGLRRQHWRDHGVNLGTVKRALRMIDQGLRDGDHDGLVLLNQLLRFLIAAFDKRRDARHVSADEARKPVRTRYVAGDIFRRPIETNHFSGASAHQANDCFLHDKINASDIAMAGNVVMRDAVSIPNGGGVSGLRSPRPASGFTVRNDGASLDRIVVYEMRSNVPSFVNRNPPIICRRATGSLSPDSLSGSHARTR
jgi:hypothetical protein